MVANNKTKFDYGLRMSLSVAIVSVSAFIASGYDYGRNFISEIIPFERTSASTSGDYDVAAVTTRYYDGLGVEIATVRSGMGVDCQSVLEYVEYALGGKIKRKWQPVDCGYSNDFMDLEGVMQKTESFYSDNKAYTEFTYNPINGADPYSIRKPGEAQGDSVATVLNIPDCGSVPIYEIDGQGRLVLTNDIYKEGCLRINRITDESGRISETYTDFDDRVILTARISSSERQALETFYVYDDCGRLCFVIPPEASSRLTVKGICDNDVVAKYCYRYVYDNRNRIIEKQLPGKQSEYLVYDKLGRIIFSSDAGLLASGKWRFFAYDKKHRPAVSGCASIPAVTPARLREMWADSLLTANFNKLRDNDIAMNYDVALSYEFETHRVWFYDNYDFWTAWWDIPAHSILQAQNVANRNGKSTGSAVMVDGFPVYTINMFDRDGYEIAQCEKSVNERYTHCIFRKFNSLGQPTMEYDILDFPYNEWNTEARHSEVVTSYQYYLPGGSLAFVHTKIDGKQMPVVAYDIDDIGRSTKVGSTATSYDVQNRLYAINNPHFTETLRYGADGLLSSKKSKYGIGEDARSQKLAYTYDGFARLLESVQTNDSENLQANLFTEDFSYDGNGNITAFSRGGFTNECIQRTAMTYSGNRISQIVDESDDMFSSEVPRFESGVYNDPFAYRADGTPSRDLTRSISKIDYDINERPALVRFDNGNSITYTYDMSGKRRAMRESVNYITTVPKTVAGDTVIAQEVRQRNFSREYHGRFTCENSRITRIDGINGFYRTSDNGWQYYETVVNYLGSPVVVVDANGSVKQQVMYYASGLPVVKNSEAVSVNDRFHIGKEFSMFEGLGWYDNDARQYDAIIPHFDRLDPLAEKYYEMSPYLYCASNPNLYIDPDGQALWKIDDRGNVLEFDKKFKDADRFELVDTDLNPLKDSNGNDLVFSLKTGTVESYRHIKDGGAGYEIFKVRGDKNATDLFEFLSDNITGKSEVEFSMIRTGEEGDKGQNFISTSHMSGSDVSFWWLYRNQIVNNYHFKEFTHSHPKSRDPSTSDKATRALFKDMQPKFGLAIPKLFIYHVPTKTYKPY